MFGENLTGLKARLESNERLQVGDIGRLQWAVKATKKRLKTSFFKTLCYTSFLCKKDRGFRAKEKIANIFMEGLDIRKLVDDHFKLNLLIETIFTDTQKFLFKNQHSKIV